MRILVTNDDGILAPGLLALRRALADMGEVAIVAPTTPQSAVGHSITLTDPIRVHRVDLGGGLVGQGVEGSPADCVKLAVLELLDEPPDLVASGVIGQSGLELGRHEAGVAGGVEEMVKTGQQDVTGSVVEDKAAANTAPEGQ